jgi:glycine/D-amino acid oxidase-like deaminating enzyme
VQGFAAEEKMTIEQALWAQSAAEEPISGAFRESTVDVAIIGGGYTGLSCALHCAQAGQTAHVLEAQSVGYGGSGRNVGLVNAGLWLPPAKLVAALGDRGPSFLELFGDAPRQVFEIIEKYQIRCEATREGTIHAAHAPRGMADLQGRFEEWKRLGAPVELLNAGQAAEMTGSPSFAGGLWDQRAGTINPMGYARGLARAAKAEGAEISTGVQVQGLRRVGANWQVETAQGHVTARAVVMATNAYSDALWPGLSKCWQDIHFFQLSTAPLGDLADAILPGKQGLWDTGLIMRSLRKDTEGRLIVGSMGRMFGTPQSGLTMRRAGRILRHMFPDLGPVAFETGWDGTIAMTPDHLPRIVKLDEGLFTPIGYNGRGVTTGTLFGRSMAQMLGGGDPEQLPLPLTTLEPVGLKQLSERFYDLGFTLNQLR